MPIVTNTDRFTLAAERFCAGLAQQRGITDAEQILDPGLRALFEQYFVLLRAREMEGDPSFEIAGMHRKPASHYYSNRKWKDRRR